ncbi:MAG: hypothetical protein IT262_01705 [Saprospiraceae bacterium]|nr:hypothetical protein [Saprospiraceae bacterium]
MLNRYKVFLCYAREDQPLMDDFCDRFRNYNEGDWDILCDRNAANGNMHEVFKKFAKECDVAVLLVNARFLNPNSYANQYEMPVLIERQKANEVIIVGVRISNVSDLDQWNAKGDVFFVQVTNNDLPFTRDKKRDDRAYHQAFAVYEQIAEQDRNDFHDRLRGWIKKCLYNRSLIQAHFLNTPSEKPENKFEFRPFDKTEFILRNLSGFYHQIEKTLSMNNDFWRGNPPSNQDWDKPSSGIFFGRHYTCLAKIHEELEALSPNEAFFTDRLHRYLPKIEESVSDCRLLIEVSDVGELPLYSSLFEAERYIKKSQKNLLLKSDKRATEELKNLNFPTLKHHLLQLIKRLEELKNDFENMNLTS